MATTMKTKDTPAVAPIWATVAGALLPCPLTMSAFWMPSGYLVASGENVNDGVKIDDGVKVPVCLEGGTFCEGVNGSDEENSEEGEKRREDVNPEEGAKELNIRN